MLIRSKKTNTKDMTSRLICALLCIALSIGTMMIPDAAFAASEGVTNAKVVLREKADKES